MASISVVSRRDLFGLASAATAAAALPTFLTGTMQAQVPAETAQVGAHAATQLNPAALRQSIQKAITFQNLMMDAYAAGTTVRLTQSYSDEALLSTAFTYDNAVSIHAYLASGMADGLTRAEVLGNGLLYAQAHNFPFHDGRFGQAYFVNKADTDGAFINPAAAPFYFYTSATGDQAWAGMALAQLFYRTQNAAYLNGALLVANWIVNNTYSKIGPGGFAFGTNINQFNQSVPSGNGKATEHNIDCYAFFTMLVKLTSDGVAANGMLWSQLAQHALQFVTAMYNPAGPYFYTGTLGDQSTINPQPIPEDTQTWSYMAFLDQARSKTIDWALANLQTTDTAASPRTSLTGTQTVHGLVFDTASLTTTTADPNAVWLEGTAHTAAALVARVLRGQDTLAGLFADISQAAALLNQCQRAQSLLGSGKTVGGKAIPQGYGLVAATSVLDTGFGYTYGPSLHIGATGWYLLAGLAANPFQLGYRVVL